MSRQSIGSWDAHTRPRKGESEADYWKRMETSVIVTTCPECHGADGHHWDFCPAAGRERLARIAARPLWKKIIDRIKAAYEADDLAPDANREEK